MLVLVLVGDDTQTRSWFVLDDADLDLAIANTAWDVYLHQGQICMATGRLVLGNVSNAQNGKLWQNNWLLRLPSV